MINFFLKYCSNPGCWVLKFPKFLALFVLLPLIVTNSLGNLEKRKKYRLKAQLTKEKNININ